MQLGLNLSFATKRWLQPENPTRMCKVDFGMKYIQFTFDLIDPWWPENARNTLARQYRDAVEKQGLEITSAFGCVASYTYAQFLAPTEIQREISFEFFKRAIDLTRELGAETMGTPIGGMSFEDAREEDRRDELYKSALWII